MIDNKFFPIMGSGFNMALANFVWDKKISAKEFSHKLLHEISYDGELEIVENHYKSDNDSKIEVFFRVKDSNGFPNYYKEWLIFSKLVLRTLKRYAYGWSYVIPCMNLVHRTLENFFVYKISH